MEKKFVVPCIESICNGNEREKLLCGDTLVTEVGRWNVILESFYL